MMNEDPPRDGSDVASTAQPFVAPVPGLGAFTPKPNPYSQATFRFERSAWLLLPLAYWTIGVARHDAETLAIGLAAWIVSYPVYGAWSLWRIKDADPKADLWRPIALLTLGAFSFLGFIPLGIVHSWAAFAVLVLVTYLVGIAVLVAARSGWPREGADRVIAAAARACWVVAALAVTATALIAVAASRSHPVAFDFIFGGGALVFALVIALLGVALMRAARRARRAA